MKKKEIVWIVYVIVSFVSMLAIVLLFLPYNLQSDSAFFPLLAHWEIATGKIFPDGMCYSTQVLGLSPNLYMIPFLAVFGEHYLLARTLGIFTIWIMIVCLLFVLYRGRSIMPACVVSILFLVPYADSVATEEYFFEAAYVNQIRWMVLSLILCTYLRELLGDGRKKAANAAAAATAMIAVIVYSNSCGIRNLLITFIPMTGAVILLVILEHLDELAKGETAPAKWLVEAGKRAVPFAAIFLVGGILAIFAYKGISARVWPFQKQPNVYMASPEMFTDRVLKFINSIMSICGGKNRVRLFGLKGISRLCNYIYTMFLFVGVPWYSVRNFRQIRRDRTKLIVLTAHISSLMLAFICIIADFEMLSNDEARYCLPIYMNNILVLGALLADGWHAERSRAAVRRKKSGQVASGVRQTGKSRAAVRQADGSGAVALEMRQIFIRCLPIIILCYAMFTHYTYWRVNIARIQRLPDPYGLTEYLEDHGCTHGYASYWNAHKYTILSDFRVVVADVKVEEHSVEPYYWLTNKEYYSAKKYDGPTFLMLTAEEVPVFDAYGAGAAVYGQPEEQLKYGEYTIYRYGYNILNISKRISYEKINTRP